MEVAIAHRPTLPASRGRRRLGRIREDGDDFAEPKSVTILELQLSARACYGAASTKRPRGQHPAVHI
jgi:hypothetical protein